MSVGNGFILIFVLIFLSCIFSMSEIALAASRKIKLRQMADDGDSRAQAVLDLQESPGSFFTVVQVALNAVAILAGIIGELSITPALRPYLDELLGESAGANVSFFISFIVVTSLFILFADLIPKRIAMAMPERVALPLLKPLELSISVFRPIVWFFNGAADAIFKIFKIPTVRIDEVTPDDIYAVMAAGTEAGVLDEGEQRMIENVFEMHSVSVTSAMTTRDQLFYLMESDSKEVIVQKIISGDIPGRFLVCREVVDSVVGYIDAKELLVRVLRGDNLDLMSPELLHVCPVIPDTLSLSETLEFFKANRYDFAVVMNEYGIVLGVVTTDDLQSAVMGAWAISEEEEQIIIRDSKSWLIDGVTPLTDVGRVLGIDNFPYSENYETIAGFMIYMLRKIPRRTDSVEYSGYTFEVVDVENHKISQLLVSRLKGDLDLELL